MNQQTISIFKKWHLVLYLSWSDIKARYARSFLGPLWLVMTTALSVVGLGYVWSSLFSIDKAQFIPFLSVGLVIWQFLSTCIIEGTTIFSVSSAVMRNTCNPILVFPFTLVCKNLIILAHNSLVLLVVFSIYPPTVSLFSLLLLPGLVLVVANIVWMVTLTAMVGARYRDIGPAIQSFMTILFFLSPVMYKPEQLGVKAQLLWFNPFSHMITAIREPLSSGQPAPLFVYITLVSLLIIGWLVTVVFMKKFRHRIIYWV